MSKTDFTLTRELEISKEKFELVFNFCPAAMALRKLSDLTYVEVNQAWLNYTGFQRDEIVGKTATELAIRDNFLAWQNKYGNQLSGKAEVQFGTKSGEIRTGIWTFNIIEVDKEKYVLTSIIDITDNKKLEVEMHKLDRLNIIGEMAAGVAHEIRNPLTVIKGYLQHMYLRVDLSMKGSFDIALQELASVEALITDFLSLAKNKVVQKSSQDLNVIVEGLRPLLLADLAPKGIGLEMRLQSQLPLMVMNEKEIKQLILNLSRNGVEAMDKHGVLTLSTEYLAGEIVLTVSDNGSGIPSDLQQRVFDPFFTTKDNGTGLGLPICASIVQRHDGKLQMYSAVGKGTNFKAHFPTY